MLYDYSNPRIQFKYSFAAGHFNIISFIPSKAGNEKKKDLHICHKNPAAAKAAAGWTDDGIPIIEVLSSIRHSQNKKHAASLTKAALNYLNCRNIAAASRSVAVIPPGKQQSH